MWLCRAVEKHAEEHEEAGARLYGSYVDGPASPLFPFGHGLSYGRRCELTHLSITSFGAAAATPARATLTVVAPPESADRRAGPHGCSEVVQCYVQDPPMRHVRRWLRHGGCDGVVREVWRCRSQVQRRQRQLGLCRSRAVPCWAGVELRLARRQRAAGITMRGVRVGHVLGQFWIWRVRCLGDMQQRGVPGGSS